MAESITWNNAVYIIPDVGESNWGQNLTNYFVAISQGAYQASGGTLPLTADLSFGTNFGLFTKYVTSVTATPASAGVIRLAKTDAVEWRNNANAANLALSIDGSDNLLWNGDIIATSASSPVLSIAGTASQITASAATGNVTLSIPAAFIAPGSIAATSTLKGTTVTATATTSQIILGTTNTVTLSSTAPASSRTYTLPDAGGSANVVLDAGNYTIGGTWAFSNTITMGASKGIIFTDNTSNAVTMKATNSTTSWTFNLPPTHGTSNQFLQTDGAGNTSWQPGGAGTVTSGTAGNLTLYPATAASVNDTYVQNSHNITIGIATQGSRSAALAITIPNPGNAITTANVVLDVGNYTMTGVYTFNSGAGAITMSGSTIAMGTGKITGLGNGTASTDAAAFGQIFTGFQAAIQVTESTGGSTTSASFASVGATASITPTSATHRIKVTIFGLMNLSASATAHGIVGISAAGSDIFTTSSSPIQYEVNATGGLGANSYSPYSLTFIHSPATASAITYATRIAVTGTGTFFIGGTGISGSNTGIILEEIV